MRVRGVRVRRVPVTRSMAIAIVAVAPKHEFAALAFTATLSGSTPMTEVSPREASVRQARGLLLALVHKGVGQGLRLVVGLRGHRYGKAPVDNAEW